MAAQVLCPRCGAPHRVATALTRFTCGFCQSLVEVSLDPVAEELLVPGQAQVAVARDLAQRALLLAGGRQGAIHAEPARWIGMWHIVSEAGEEHLLPATDEPRDIARMLHVPSAPLLARDDPTVSACGPLPVPAVNLQQAVRAARAAFEEADAAIDSARLVWVQAVPLRVGLPSAWARGLYFAGAEHVVLAPLPERVRAGVVQRARIQIYLAYVAMSAALGALVHDPVARLLACGGLFCAGWWMARADRTAHAPSSGRGERSTSLERP